MRECELCGKRPKAGQSIQYNHGGKWFRRAPKTKRLFVPNLQFTHMQRDGERVRVKACTKCMKAGKTLRAAL